MESHASLECHFRVSEMSTKVINVCLSCNKINNIKVQNQILQTLNFRVDIEYDAIKLKST